MFRSYVFLPNPLTWYRRFSGLAHKTSGALMLSSYLSNLSGALALLSFCVPRVFPRWTFEKAPSFFVPLSFFPFQPLSKPENGTPGVSFQRRSSSPLSKGARPSDVFDRLTSATISNCEPATAYFFSSESLSSYENRDPRLCRRSHFS
jgi:hypothetical protein